MFVDTARLASSDIDGMSRNAHLQLSVWDFDRANADDLIGACVLPIKDIFAVSILMARSLIYRRL